MTKIAARYGFTRWRAIYEHPENAALRQRRPNPDILLPGDVVFIPDKKEKIATCPTGQTHQFIVKRQPLQLHLVVKDEKGRSLDGKRYELVVGVSRYTGKLGGPIAHPIPPDADEATLSIWTEDTAEKPSLKWKLRIGHLDPIDSVSGAQARLNNLGFWCGLVDGKPGPLTEAAIKRFQEQYGLTADGVLGLVTQAKLKEVYGC